MDIVTLIGLVSSIMGIVSVFVSDIGWQDKKVHAVYSVLLFLIGGTLLYTQAARTSERYEHEQKIAEIESIERQATRIAEQYYDHGDGAKRGLVLAGLSFLEKHKSRYPDTYSRAEEFAKAAGILKIDEDQYEQRRSLEDGADAMLALLRGLAASEKFGDE